MTADKIIRVARTHDQDASRAASLAAQAHGTTIHGNLRWGGALAPAYRRVATADGREVRVYEPEFASPYSVAPTPASQGDV